MGVIVSVIGVGAGVRYFGAGVEFLIKMGVEMLI